MTRIDTPAGFGSALATRRRSLGLTQQQLAFAAGVNRRVIGELERGKPSVQLDIALRVAQALGLTLSMQERD